MWDKGFPDIAHGCSKDYPDLAVNGAPVHGGSASSLKRGSLRHMPQSTQGIIIMFKKLLLAVTLFFSVHAGFAASTATPSVDVNKADRPALESIKGIGPAAAESILGERAKKGGFKDWADFETRVKGVGDARAIKLSDAGLTVNGEARPAGAKHAESKKGESKKGESKKGESKKAADETVSLKK